MNTNKRAAKSGKNIIPSKQKKKLIDPSVFLFGKVINGYLMSPDDFLWDDCAFPSSYGDQYHLRVQYNIDEFH